MHNILSLTVRVAIALLLAVTLFGCSGAGSPSGDSTADASIGRGDGQGGEGDDSLGGGSGNASGGEAGGGSSDGSGGSSEDPALGTAGGSARLAQTEIARRIFDPTVTDFVVHVFYETGAEPYTGRLGLTSDATWDITGASYRELFDAHAGRRVTVPTRLDQMQSFEDRGNVSWSVDALLELGDSLVPPLVADDRIHLSIVFVNGLFDGNERILGIHIANTHYAFVFKDVVKSVGGDGTTQRYVEQTTVVHELGHTVGFVDNGVPMVNAHEDAEHPHHTVNRDGVMYWAVESRSGVLSFLSDIITGSDLTLFGPETRLDAQNFMPAN